MENRRIAPESIRSAFTTRPAPLPVWWHQSEHLAKNKPAPRWLVDHPELVELSGTFLGFKPFKDPLSGITFNNIRNFGLGASYFNGGSGYPSLYQNNPARTFEHDASWSSTRRGNSSSILVTGTRKPRPGQLRRSGVSDHRELESSALLHS